MRKQLLMETKFPVDVYCGNGGDYEFMRDQHYWYVWIRHNMPDANVTITDHRSDCDKAHIWFNSSEDVFIFNLKFTNFWGDENHVRLPCITWWDVEEELKLDFMSKQLGA